MVKQIEYARFLVSQHDSIGFVVPGQSSEPTKLPNYVVQSKWFTGLVVASVSPDNGPTNRSGNRFAVREYAPWFPTQGQVPVLCPPYLALRPGENG